MIPGEWHDLDRPEPQEPDDKHEIKWGKPPEQSAGYRCRCILVPVIPSLTSIDYDEPELHDPYPEEAE